MSYMKQLFDRHKQEDIFMEYFDELPDEDKKKLHKRLEGLGL